MTLTRRHVAVQQFIGHHLAQEQILRSLFDTPVEVSVARERDYFVELPTEEARFVAGSIETRQQEFAAGRTCARRCIERLGARATALPRDIDRLPVWPTDVVGSISHCRGCCCAVAGRTAHICSIGVDIEENTALPERLVSKICLPSECSRGADFASSTGIDWAKLTFSAKEAAYKCYFPVFRTFLAFHDVEIRFEITATAFGSFYAELRDASAPAANFFSSLKGKWAVSDTLVYCGAIALRNA